MIWWLAFEKRPFQFWRKIWIQVVVILLQLYLQRNAFFFSNNLSPPPTLLPSLPLKLRYCEKATKSKRISHSFLKLLSIVKTKREIFSNFCGLLRISDLYYPLSLWKHCTQNDWQIEFGYPFSNVVWNWNFTF